MWVSISALLFTISLAIFNAKELELTPSYATTLTYYDVTGNETGSSQCDIYGGQCNRDICQTFNNMTVNMIDYDPSPRRPCKSNLCSLLPDTVPIAFLNILLCSACIRYISSDSFPTHNITFNIENFERVHIFDMQYRNICLCRIISRNCIFNQFNIIGNDIPNYRNMF